MTIRIDTLGTLAVYTDGTPLPGLPAQPIRCGLLVYLAVERQATRDALLAMFWPDSTTDAARHALSQTLYRLRMDLGTEWLKTLGDQLFVSSSVEVDFHAFTDAVKRGEYRRALALHAGPFLGGMYLVDTSGYEAWVSQKRSEGEALFQKANRGYIAAETRSGNLTVAIQTAQKWVAADPLQEEGQRTLITLLAASGQRLNAIKQYEKYERLLADEMDVVPLAATKELVDRIKRGDTIDRESAQAVEPPARQSDPQSLDRFHRRRASDRVGDVPNETGLSDFQMDGLADRYQIEHIVGRGGMATVYLAKDTRHGRRVAVKVLHPEITSTVAPERFLREIEITAALSHPHIVAVHDSGQVDNLLYYVMPYVDGESLGSRLAKQGPLQIADAIRIIRDIADALAYAHDRGIVHRDIKPDNVMLSGRYAFVTDFGVAKAVSAPTADKNLTAVNMTVGTPAYMAPEQATGSADVDHRADIFALGAVAYETLTGQVPFPATSAEHALNARISMDPIPLSQHRPDIDPQIEKVVMKCLERSPAERWQHAREVVEALESHVITGGGARAAANRKISLRAGMLVGGTLLTAAAVVAWILSVKPAAPVRPAATFRQLSVTGDVVSAAISPDGRYVAYLRGPQTDRSLMVMPLNTAEAAILRSGPNITYAEWHPNGQEILFYVSGGDGAASGTFSIPLVGGQPRRVSNATIGTVSPDGTRLASFAPSGNRILIESLAGQATDTVPLSDSFTWLAGVSWSPAGQRLAYITANPERLLSDVWTVDDTGTRPRRVLHDSVFVGSVLWSPRGDALYYLRPGIAVMGGMYALWKLPVNQRTGVSRGDPVLLHSGLDIAEWSLGETGMSVTDDGRRFAYVREVRRANLVLLEFNDATGEYVLGRRLTTGTSYKANPSISPDGQWVAYSDGDASVRNIFKTSINRTYVQQLTFDSVNFDSPVWSPNGDMLAFGANRPGGARVWTVSAQGGALQRHAGTRLSPALRLVWAPGKDVMYRRPDNRNFYLLDPTTDQERPLLADDSVGWLALAMTNPAGDRVAVSWNRQGGPEPGIWIVSLNDASEELVASGREWELLGWSQQGRDILLRRANGHEVFLVSTADHQRRLLGRLPPDCLDVTFMTDLRGAVCQLVETSRDVWLVEDFDSGTPSS